MTDKIIPWDDMCEDISIASVKHYKSRPSKVKSDRVRVEVDLPIELYAQFRQSIEAPRSLRNRRAEDNYDDKVLTLSFMSSMV